MITAQLPDGTQLQFPDGTADAVIDKVVKTHIKPQQPSAKEGFMQGVGNVAAGALRGAGSIGATAMRILPNALGGDTASENETRRQQMDAALQSMGAQPDSLAYKGGKLGAEIAGTAGAGGAIARGASAIPGVATAAPNLLNAIRTAGMTAGNGGAMANALTRAAGGAVTGGASAGMVNPEDAGMGAVIGGAAPTVLRAAGAVGTALGRAINGPAQNADVIAAIQAARGAGYVIPPTQANPTLLNRLLEGVSGKITTAQNASARNQQVTNRLVADTIGIPNDAPITRDALNAVRHQAGQVYDAVANAGVITPGTNYERALNRIVAPYQTAAQGFPNAQPSPVIEAINSLRSPSFDSSAAVAQLRNVREMADTAFSQGNRGVGRSLREGADALESAIEDHLAQVGMPQQLQAFRDARQLIARTYSAEKALNPVTGNIDAKKLAAQVAKNRPMTGPMREAADFAARFPKASQTVEQMGSLPQTSPLDWHAAGAVGMATQNPLALAGVVARPAARAMTLSNLVQNRLVQNPGGNALANLLTNDASQQAIYRAAPVALGQR